MEYTISTHWSLVDLDAIWSMQWSACNCVLKWISQGLTSKSKSKSKGKGKGKGKGKSKGKSKIKSKSKSKKTLFHDSTVKQIKH